MTAISSIVRSDIINSNEIISNKDICAAEKMCIKLIGTYSDYINGITNGLTQYEYGDVDYIFDLELLVHKLEVFKGNDCVPTTTFKKTGINISSKSESNNTNTNDNRNENINNNTLSLEFLFKEARETIENDGSLNEEDIKEVLEKIDEIEKINSSEEPNNKKWFKLRPIMNWVGTKGLNIAITILNLITAIIKIKS